MPGPIIRSLIPRTTHKADWVYYHDPIGDGYGSITGYWCRKCDPTRALHTAPAMLAARPYEQEHYDPEPSHAR